MFNQFFPKNVYIDSNHTLLDIQATYMHEVGDIILRLNDYITSHTHQSFMSSVEEVDSIFKQASSQC